MDIKELSNLDRSPAIIVGVSWVNGLGLLRSLGQARVPILALSPQRNAIGFNSRYATHHLVCPESTEHEDDFVEFLVQLGSHLNEPGVLFVTRDQDMAAISRNQDRLHQFLVPSAGWSVISRIVDKQGQYATAQQIGIPLPRTEFPRDRAEAVELAQELPYPVIVKPAYHAKFSERFGVKGFVADSPRRAVEYFCVGRDHGYDMMLQEIIPGEPDHLYTFGSYLNRQGEVLAQFTGRKLRQRPRLFGTCRLGETCAEPTIVDLGIKMLRALGFWGISQVEFKLDPRDHQFKLIEVNCRSYQWQHLATVCGANIAQVAYLDMLGASPAPQIASTKPQKWILLTSDLVMSPIEAMRGQLSVKNWLKGWRGVAVDGLLSIRDPLPGLAYIWNKLRRPMGSSS